MMNSSNSQQEIASCVQKNQKQLEDEVVGRFLRYVQVFTTSDKNSQSLPSTRRQFDLARMLEKEIQQMISDFAAGVDCSVRLTEQCYVLASFAGSGAAADFEPLCLLAHMDTSPDAPGENVRPRVWQKYDGGDLQLGEGTVLTVQENPLLKNYTGEAIITSSGDTLLGADDKAGIAEIMTAVGFLLQHPEIPRPPLEIVFTPDEEIGRGLDGFSPDMIRSRAAYTFDGGQEGELEAECFHAARARISFAGKAIHPGFARGRLVNAVSMAAAFVQMLPRNESPEATDGRHGYYAPLEIRGRIDSAELDVYLRDFELTEEQRRIDALRAMAAAVEAQFPGGRVEVEIDQQYRNMRDAVAKRPELLELARRAMSDAGVQPLEKSIRGGTDGARLSEMGIPTPNIFAGGMNFHSLQEWIPVPALVSATKTAILLVYHWGSR